MVVYLFVFVSGMPGCLLFSVSCWGGCLVLVLLWLPVGLGLLCSCFGGCLVACLWLFVGLGRWVMFSYLG